MSAHEISVDDLKGRLVGLVTLMIDKLDQPQQFEGEITSHYEIWTEGLCHASWISMLWSASAITSILAAGGSDKEAIQAFWSWWLSREGLAP